MVNGDDNYGDDDEEEDEDFDKIEETIFSLGRWEELWLP